MPLGSSHPLEKDLEKRSLNGAYIYLPAWLLIGFASGYSGEQTVVFWEVALTLLLLGTLRLLCFHHSEKLMDQSFTLWWALFLFNSLGPAAIFGVLFAMSMAVPEYSGLFIYLLMTLFALMSGGTVSFSTHRRLSNIYLLALTLPALFCTIFLDINRGTEGTMLFVYMVFMFFQIKRLNEEYTLRIEQRRELETLTKIDSLTEIYNRRYFEEVLAFYWKSHRRTQQPLALLLIDIDHFKKVNDTFGHPAGDEVLRQVSRAIDQTFRRETDVVARIGGEEFAVLISQTEFDFIEKRADDIRAQIEKLEIVFEQQAIVVTVSIGAVSLLPKEGVSRSKFYKAADTCLYEAKQQGRNRVVSKNQFLTRDSI